tara:strand:- start:818 stop:925 length:108 start_codon:yes stop_codon:yes gene_type:complete
MAEPFGFRKKKKTVKKKVPKKKVKKQSKPKVCEVC